MSAAVNPVRAPRAQSGSPEQVDLLLDGGTVITMDPERRVYRSGAVAVKGDQIAGVARHRDVRRMWSARRVIDTTDAVVLPASSAPTPMASRSCTGDSATSSSSMLGYEG